jgi:hypothetical protein
VKCRGCRRRGRAHSRPPFPLWGMMRNPAAMTISDGGAEAQPWGLNHGLGYGRTPCERVTLIFRGRWDVRRTEVAM